MPPEWMQQIVSGARPRAAMPIMTFPAHALTGFGIREMVSDGEAQFACIEALADRYPSLAALTAMDLSVEAEAFGCTVKFTPDEVPSVITKAVRGVDSIGGLSIPAVGSGRTAEYLKAARLSCMAINDRPVLGGCIGPFSLAGRLMDTNELMLALIKKSGQVHELLEKCTSFIIEYGQAFKNTGLDGIIVAEPMAGLLSPGNCETFSSRYVARMVDALQDDGFVVILHNCGRTQKLVESLVNIGAWGLHFGNAVNMQEIARLIPKERIFFGNIDPVGIFLKGTPADVEQCAMQLLCDMDDHPNFVLSSGCDIPPGTRIENIDAFFRALDRYNYCSAGEIRRDSWSNVKG